MGKAINIRKLKFDVMTSDKDVKSLPTYDKEKVVNLLGRFMSYDDTPEQQTASQYGDGVKQSEYVAKIGGALELALTYLTQDDKDIIYGQKKTGRVSGMGRKDIIPFLCVTFMVDNDDGTVDLYKYPKVKFTEGKSGLKQKDEKGVEYSTTSLSGSYMFPFMETALARYTVEDLDEVTDKDYIEQWYSDPTFVEIPEAETPPVETQTETTPTE